MHFNGRDYGNFVSVKLQDGTRADILPCGCGGFKVETFDMDGTRTNDLVWLETFADAMREAIILLD